MTYTNEMRMAVRAIGNPTNVEVHVSQLDDKLFLLVNMPQVARLSKAKRKDLGAYLDDVVSVIELGGGGTPEIVGIQ